MLITGFNIEKQCESLEELKEALELRNDASANHFTLTSPLSNTSMTIAIKENLACVHFFDNEKNLMYYAFIEDNVLPEENYSFLLNTQDGETRVSRDLVIPIIQAYVAAIDYYQTSEMSDRVSWFEL